MAISRHRGICKIGACEPQCGMIFEVEAGKITSVRPDPEHPISRGYACVKGMAIPQYQNDPDRLLHPIKKNGDRYDAIPWATASKEIGEKLRSLADQYGPNSIATYWGNAADSSAIIMANSLCSAFKSPNAFNVLSLEYTDRGAVAQRMFNNEHLILQPDADNTSFALLLGTNPLVTQGMTLLQRRPRIGGGLKDIRNRGGKLVVVDPRVTETTKVADQHIAIRPGTDLFLLLGMLKTILDRELYDAHYLKHRTVGIEAWRLALKPIEYAYLSKMTDVPETVIYQLAEEFARAKSAFITSRVGVQTSRNTTLTEWLIQTLNAVTGNIGKEGGLYFHSGAINNTELVHQFTKDKNSSPSRIGNYPQIFGGIPASVFSKDVLSDHPDRIRALVVIAGNPVISFPNTVNIEAALKRLDLLVCIDIYQSDTGAFAHYNLPATTIYEKGGMHFLTQPFDPYPYAEWRNKLVEPKGQCRPEWDIVRDISRAAGVNFLNNKWLNLLDKGLGLFGKQFKEEHLVQALLLSGYSKKKMRLSQLKKTAGIKFADIKFDELFEKDILTEDKKINLAPHSFIAELENVVTKTPKASDEFPFLLISGGRRLASFNTWTHNMVELSKNLKGNYATINASDAKTYKLSTGDEIVVKSATGRLRIRVEISEDIRAGVIMIHQFWGHRYASGQNNARLNPGVNVNFLHSDTDIDTFTGMPIFNGTPCTIDQVFVPVLDG